MSARIADPLKTRSSLLGTRRVNVKRDERTAERVRGFVRGVIVRGAVMYLALTASMLAGREALGYLAAGDLFRLRTIQVDGVEHLTRKQVLAAAGIAERMNVFDVDLLAARRSLESQDWIKSAVLNRVLPDGLMVRIEERKAAGLLVMDGVAYLVDADGEPFVVAKDQDFGSWPQLTGLSRADFEQYENGCLLVRKALEMADRYLEHRMGRTARLQRVHYGHGSFNLLIGESPTTVHLGHGSLGRKLDRLAKLWAHLNEEGMNAKAIRLDNRKNPERVAVELWDAPDDEIDQLVSDLDETYPNI